MKPSGIGGQAVMEGVMMKNGDKYAVAVRKEDNSIVVKCEEYSGIFGDSKWLKLPFIRGVFNFIDSMVLGVKTLTWSADIALEEENDKGEKKEQKKEETKEGGNGAMLGLTVLLSLALAIGLFMVLPVFLANLAGKVIASNFWLTFLEGVIRIVVFLGYVIAISQMKDIKRVYMYHGAEHKCINCIEHGLDLTVENVRASSRLHKRCGTSFLLIVMCISLLVSLFIRTRVLWLRVLSRILLLPVIAGISYEFLRLAGRSENPLVCALSKPGLMLQKLTTKEPEDAMIEIGIASVEAVFDWKAFLHEEK